jgi:hypothetical protein
VIRAGSHTNNASPSNANDYGLSLQIPCNVYALWGALWGKNDGLSMHCDIKILDAKRAMAWANSRIRKNLSLHVAMHGNVSNALHAIASS